MSTLDTAITAAATTAHAFVDALADLGRALVANTAAARVADELITTEQAAKILAVTPCTVRELARAQAIPSIDISPAGSSRKTRRYSRAEIVTYYETRHYPAAS